MWGDIVEPMCPVELCPAAICSPSDSPQIMVIVDIMASMLIMSYVSDSSVPYSYS